MNSFSNYLLFYHDQEPAPGMSVWWGSVGHVRAVECKECGETANRCSSCLHYTCPNKHVVLQHQQKKIYINCNKCNHEEFVRETNTRVKVVKPARPFWWFW